MRIYVCNRCRINLNKGQNKIHVYQQSKTKKFERKDYDLCEKCKEQLINWLEENNENIN
jgi:hypothetical protein